jgi:hypothetical protein
MVLWCMSLVKSLELEACLDPVKCWEILNAPQVLALFQATIQMIMKERILKKVTVYATYSLHVLGNPNHDVCCWTIYVITNMTIYHIYQSWMTKYHLRCVMQLQQVQKTRNSYKDHNYYSHKYKPEHDLCLQCDTFFAQRQGSSCQKKYFLGITIYFLGIVSFISRILTSNFHIKAHLRWANSNGYHEW